MAAMILTDAYVKIGTTILSTQTTNVAISYSAEAEDITAMGAGTRKHAPGGLKDWSMSFEFNSDETQTGNLFAMVGTEVPVEVRASSAVASPSNPCYKGQAIVTEFAPLGGKVGDVSRVTLSVVSAGDLTRVTV